MTRNEKFDAVMKTALSDDTCNYRPDKSTLAGIKARLEEHPLSAAQQARHCICGTKYEEKCVNEEYVIFNRRYNMFRLGKRKAFVLSLTVLLAILLLGGVIGAGAANMLKTDITGYPFINDPRVVGKWQSVDFVKDITDFKPGERVTEYGLYLKELAFIKDGKTLFSTSTGNGNLSYCAFTWTKGLVLNTQEKTAGKYEIVTMDGKEFLFMEWKSGDYIFRGMTPYYYVLMKVDSADYSGFEPKRIEDKIDYDFVPDPEVVGKWESVDFVRTKDSFRPEKRQWLSDLYLTGLSFDENGEMTFDTGYSIKWTKGLVLHPGDKTASAYEIKEINGSTYMFYQWKSGDYIFRGLEPDYYVLKKVQ